MSKLEPELVAICGIYCGGCPVFGVKCPGCQQHKPRPLSNFLKVNSAKAEFDHPLNQRVLRNSNARRHEVAFCMRENSHKKEGMW